MLQKILFSLIPLTGSFLGLSGVVGVLIGSRFFLWLLGGAIPAASTGVPTLVAAWLWRLHTGKQSGRVRMTRLVLEVVLPLACFFLFVLHPSVGYGWLYGLYWFIPVGLYVGRVCDLLQKSVFYTALASTFIAHTVGSLIWCYTIPMQPAQWLALIPVVAYERFLFAVAMTGFYHTARLARSLFSSTLVLCLKQYLRSRCQM